MTLQVGGREAALKHPANAHTDGDTYVYFTDANVLSTGDIVSLGTRYPNIDFANGGTINGMIAATNTFLELTNNDTKVVPGHGPLTNKAGLVTYRDMLVTARDRVVKLIADGRSLDEAVAARPLADIGAGIGANEEQNANFVRVIYRSLKP
jgi:glyoxylase-like metal-dependent hydrolase (beta-lactamase superfamily II)